MKKKRKSAAHRAKVKRRKKPQRTVKRYAELREELQLAGRLPTTPEGAVRNEVVDPTTQDSQRFPGLDRMAIREDGEGWSVPQHVKRKVVEVNAEVLFERRVGWDKDGNEVELPPDRFAQSQASKVLLAADKHQHEVDHPKLESKPGDVNVNVGVAVQQLSPFEAYRQHAMIEEQVGELIEGETQPATDERNGQAKSNGQPAK